MKPKPSVSSEFSPSRSAAALTPKVRFQPLRVDAGDQLLQPAQILRQVADEVGELA